MTETFKLLPKSQEEWSQISDATVTHLFIAGTEVPADLDIERIIGLKDDYYTCRDLELLGQGHQGDVYGVGRFAVKFFESTDRHSRGVNGDYNMREPFNQTRIAAGVHEGLTRRSSVSVSAPAHYAYAEWQSNYSYRRKALQVMDRIDIDADSPSRAAPEVTTLVQKEVSKALKVVGIKPKTIYWYDLEKNILMSGGKPVVTDILPVDNFLQRYPF